MNDSNTNSNDDEKKVVLISGDNTRRETTRKIAKTCKLLADMLIEADDDEEASEIPLPEVKSTILEKVLEFCTHHVDDPLPEIPKPVPSSDLTKVAPKWDVDFVDEEMSIIFELILAANYLDNSSLLNLCCAKIASLAVGKPIREIRKIFGIQSDLTKEEREMFDLEQDFLD